MLGPSGFGSWKVPGGERGGGLYGYADIEAELDSTLVLGPENAHSET